MYHQKLGYASLDRNVVALRAVRALYEAFQSGEGLDFPVLEALRAVADIKSFVTTVKVPQFLQIGSSPHFPRDSRAYSALYQLLLLNFESEKLFTGTYDYRVYRNDPIIPLPELIEKVTAQEIAYISLSEDLSGDKTIWGAYSAEFVEWIHNVYRIGLDEGEFTKRLLTYRQHLVYKLTRSQPLEPAEKTFICNYYPGSDYNRKLPGWDEVATAQENSNELVSRDFNLAIAQGEVGPISKYFKIISNQSIEQLTAIVIPGLQSMPLMVGSFIPRGPVSECDLTPLVTIPYNENLEMQGFRERLRTLSSADFQDKDKALAMSRCTPTMPATIQPIYSVLTKSGLPFDLMEVDLELRTNKLDPTDEYAGLRASWHSAWRGRRVSTAMGATVYDLLTDIALSNATYGSGAPVELTLPEGAVIDNTEESIRKRTIQFGSVVSNAISPVKYKVYFTRNGKLEEEAVDMRFYYARRGTTMVRPAFAEYVHPPVSMLYTSCEAAIAYIVGELGLTEEERKVNELALTVCFNFAECSMIFMGRTPPIELRQYVTTILAV